MCLYKVGIQLMLIEKSVLVNGHVGKRMDSVRKEHTRVEGAGMVVLLHTAYPSNKH